MYTRRMATNSSGPIGSMPLTGVAGAFNCPAGVLPASNPLLNGAVIPAGVASQISEYRLPQYDAPDPSYVIGGVPYWWRQLYTPPSAGPVGSIAVVGSAGLFNCPAGLLPASSPLSNGQVIPPGAIAMISNFRAPQYDAAGPSYVIGGTNYWWRQGKFGGDGLNGNALANANVVVHSSTDAQYLGKSRCDAKGIFVMTGVPAGGILVELFFVTNGNRFAVGSIMFAGGTLNSQQISFVRA